MFDSFWYGETELKLLLDIFFRNSFNQQGIMELIRLGSFHTIFYIEFEAGTSKRTLMHANLT